MDTKSKSLGAKLFDNDMVAIHTIKTLTLK